jgi:UDP-glucose 4-epimerase
MKVMVTGGAGYIGSHTCVELLQVGHEIVVVDNLSNSKKESLDRVQEITGKTFPFYQVDLLNSPALERIFLENTFDAVIHFAALKAVGESVKYPLRYYHNNITGTIVLCELMQKFGCKNIVFSSSATVYGDPARVPITEDFPLYAVNPYGNTKLIMEQVFRDLHTADPEFNAILLRYFNPIGAHPSGKIGEDPNGIPNNLVPFVAQVAVGKLPFLHVHGGDYLTPDGTGIRDYIHVVDLALGHLKALDKLSSHPGTVAYNLGTGRGYSVLDVVAAFEKACGHEIPYRIGPRRQGDAAVAYADPSLAEKELGWSAKRDIEEMCADSWRWQSNNPNGYE